MERNNPKVAVSKEGSLGLLATGFVGLMAWRKARMNQKAPERKKDEG